MKRYTLHIIIQRSADTSCFLGTLIWTQCAVAVWCCWWRWGEGNAKQFISISFPEFLCVAPREEDVKECNFFFRTIRKTRVKNMKRDWAGCHNLLKTNVFLRLLEVDFKTNHKITSKFTQTTVVCVCVIVFPAIDLSVSLRDILKEFLSGLQPDFIVCSVLWHNDLYFARHFVWD